MGSEALARATYSSDLAFEEGVVHDIDRVIAMATGNALGGLLFRYARAAQDQWGRRIVLILARRIGARFRLGREIAERSAAVALVEFTRPHCHACGGARELEIDKVKVPCDACGGTGLQRYTNSSRREAIGTYGRRIDEAIAYCHDAMSTALGEFLGEAHGRLA